MYQLIFSFYADFGFTAVYSFTDVYLRLHSHLSTTLQSFLRHLVTVTFWGCTLGRTDMTSALGKCNSLSTPPVSYSKVTDIPSSVKAVT